jgi:uncharacterized membrane-anchored protein
MATITLPPSFRFLGEQDSRKLLVAWGNPPETAQGVLGMLVPSDVSPLSEDGWAIVVTYDDDGFVNDEEAKTLNYDKVMSEMQEQTVANNEARRGGLRADRSSGGPSTALRPVAQDAGPRAEFGFDESR